MGLVEKRQFNRRGDAVEESEMPIYEYQCEKCGHEFESLVFGSEKPACPACESARVTRLMSCCGFVSKSAGGQTVSSSAGSSCGGCSASSCAGCGH
jgi:putative FmdB family regulatory protein